MAKKPRDSQRARAYKAEAEAWHDTHPVHTAWRVYQTAEEAQKRIHAIRQSSWWAERYGDRYPEMILNRRLAKGGARQEANTISFGLSGICHWVLLHELAHWVHDESSRGGPVLPSHGRAWAAIYVALTARFIGRLQAQELKGSFDTHGVKWRRSHPKRQLTEEQRAELTARLKRRNQ